MKGIKATTNTLILRTSPATEKQDIERYAMYKIGHMYIYIWGGDVYVCTHLSTALRSFYAIEVLGISFDVVFQETNKVTIFT